MKKVFLMALAVLLMASNGWALQNLFKIPEAKVKMKNVDGKQFSIADLKGEKGTLVVFSCNHCPWAKRWEKRIVRLGNRFLEKGVGVVMVNSNDPKKQPQDSFDLMVTRHKKKKYNFPYTVDATSEIARAFGATVTPEAFLFNSTGALVYHGTVDDNAENPKAVKKRYLRDALRALVKGKTITHTREPAIGCSIKWREAKGSKPEKG